jgi:hypothetical protein
MESSRSEAPLVVVGFVTLCATAGGAVVEEMLEAEELDEETVLCACGAGTAVETVAAPPDVALGLGLAIVAVNKVAELTDDMAVERVDAEGAAGTAPVFGMLPNAPGAQRHWQSHAPPTKIDPVPCATAPEDPADNGAPPADEELGLAIVAVVKVAAPPVPTAVPEAPAGGFTPGADEAALFPLAVTVTS